MQRVGPSIHLYLLRPPRSFPREYGTVRASTPTHTRHRHEYVCRRGTGRRGDGPRNHSCSYFCSRHVTCDTAEVFTKPNREGSSQHHRKHRITARHLSKDAAILLLVLFLPHLIPSYHTIPYSSRTVSRSTREPLPGQLVRMHCLILSSLFLFVSN